MAYILGEAALRVFPNMEGFHNDMKKHPEFSKANSEKIEVKVDLDRDKFNDDLRKLQSDIRDFENRNTIDIKVTADTAQAKRNVDRFRARMAKDPLQLKIQLEERSMNRAQRVFDAFHEDNQTVHMRTVFEDDSIDEVDEILGDLKNAHRDIDMFVNVNRNLADEAMDDFRAKYHGKDIVQNIIYETSPMPSMPSPKQRKGTQMGTMDRSQINRIQQEGWNVVNMWGRMWDKMNQQIEKGIIDIYDPYRQIAAKIGMAVLKPFQNFNAALQESQSFTDFFDNLRSRFSLARKDGEGFFDSMRNGFKRSKDVATDFILSTMINWGVLKDSWKSTGFLKNIRNEFTQLKNIWSGWAKAAGREMADMARIVGSRFSGMGKGITDNLREVFTSLPGFVRYQGREIGHQIATGIGSGIRSARRVFQNTFGQILSGWGGMLNGMIRRTTGANIPGVFKRMGDGIFAAFTNTWLMVTGTFGPFMSNIRALRDGILVAFNSIPGVVGRAFQGIGSQATRAFRGVQGAVGTAANAIRGRFGGLFSQLSNNFGALGAFAIKSFSNIGKAVSPVFSKLGSMANSKLFKVMRAGFNMMGNYASGFGRIAIGAFGKLAGFLMSSLMPAIMSVIAGLVVVGGASIIGGVLALGGAVFSVAQGALLLAPAFAAAAGVSFAALKIGLEGVGEGVKSAFSAETVEEFEEAIADLPAGAQDIARAFRDSKAEVDALKESIQTALTSNLGDPIRNMMDNLLPKLSEGMTNMASSWNNSIRNLLNEMGSDRAGRGLETIMQGVTDMSREMEPVLANLARGFGSLMEQGAKFMKPMGTWFADASKGFADWAESLKEINQLTGESKFDTMVQNAAKSAAYLGDIFGGLFRTIGNVFMAGAEGGEGILAGMADAMQRLADYTSRGNEGFNQLVGFMEAASRAASRIGDLLIPVFGIVADLAAGLFDLGYEALPGVTALAEALDTALDPIKNIAGTVGKALGDAIGALAPFASQLGGILAPIISGLVGGISVMVQTLGGVLNRIGPNITAFAEAFAPVIMEVGEAIAQVFVGLQPYLVSTFNVLTSLMGPLGSVFDYLGKIAGAILDALSPLFTGHDNALSTLLDNLQPVIDALGGGLLNVIEALKPPLKVIGDTFNQILIAVAPLLPMIGEMLTAAFGFLVDVLNMLAPLVPPIANFFLQLIQYLIPLVEPLKNIVVFGFNMLGQALQFIAPFIPPFANFVMTVLQHLVQFLAPLAGIILGIMGAWKLWTAAVTVFNNIMRILQGVMMAARIAQLLFNAAMRANPIGLVITLIGALVGALIYFFTQTEIGRQIWDRFTTFLGDAWQWFSNRMGIIWQWIVDNIWTPLVNWVNIIREIWNNFTTRLGDLWSGFRDRMVNIWNNIKQRVFDTVQGIVDGFKNTFQRAVDGVKSIWDGLREIFAKPIRFFIETVVNKGVVGGWNAVMDLINKRDDWGLREVPLPPGLNFARGGVLPGYTPGKDIHDFWSPTAGALHLSGGEAIMRPEWTQAIGGPKAVAQMNEDARHGRIKKPGLSRAERERLNKQHSHASGGVLDLGSFANGGVLAAMENIVGQKYPQLVPMYSGYRPGGPYHGTYQAGDFSNGTDNTPAQTGLAHDIAATYPGSAELIYEAPGFDQQIKHGSFVGPGGGSYGFYAGAGNHRNHVHWAMTEPPTMPFGGGVFEGGSGGGGGIGGWLYRGVTGLISKVFDPIKNKMKSFVEPFGHYGNLALGFGQDIISKGIQSIKDKVTELIPGWMKGGGGASFEPGAGAEQWRAGIIAAFERQGEEPRDDLVDALVRQIHTESKGNPNIAQQIVDVNGTGASAGLGLYQFIPSTFAAYRDPGLPNDRTDPDASHNAAVRYFRDRHGWNTGPGGVGRGHGWKSGGVLPDPLHLFDQGGVATGVGQMEKRVLEPERVLSPNQTRAFNDFVYGFLPTMIDDFRRRPYDINTAVDKLINGWEDVQVAADKRREDRIESMTGDIKRTFEARQSGDLKTNPIDTNLDRGWIDRNGQKLADNLAKAVGGAQQVYADPWGYLEAEERAKERIEAEREAERKAAKEERDAAEQERKQAEDERIREEEQAELDAAATEEEKEKIRAEHEAAREERQAAELERDQVARERERAEDERIKAAKESGEYYYGYKVFGEGASNPNEYERSEHEEEVLNYLDALAAPLGLEGPMGKIQEKLPVFQELGAAVQTATPAWIAAANGDPSGLQHNIAVSQAAAYEQREAELRDLGPSALAGALEMVMSTSAQQSQQPFIGEMHHHGMSDAEFARRMDYWQARQARKKRGAMRTR